jgi:uncharacterized integral membrane protein (TIGR00697 family)
MKNTQHNNFTNKTHLGIYHIITIIYTLLFLIANIAAVKVKEFGPWQIAGNDIGPWFLDVATLYFPLLYILNDVLTEVYGFIATRRIIWLSIFFASISMLLFSLAVNISAIDNEETRSFDKVFSFSPIILLASVTSFVVGEYFNSTILSKMKVKFAGKFFGFRAIISTLIGSSIESTLFAFIAFGRMFETRELLWMTFLLIASKVIYEFLSIPIIIFLVRKIKKYENIDHYDYGVKFRFLPF